MFTEYPHAEYPLRFESLIFRKTDSPYGIEFDAVSECSEFRKTIISHTGSVKLVTDENTCLYYRYDVGCKGCINILKYLFTRAIGRISPMTKNSIELATINEPLVFESLQSTV